MRNALIVVLEVFPLIVNAFSLLAGLLLYGWLKRERVRRHGRGYEDRR